VLELLHGWRLKCNFKIKLSNPEMHFQKTLVSLDDNKLKKEHLDFDLKFQTIGERRHFYEPFDNMSISAIQKLLQEKNVKKYCDM
jgi:hypothetical protein